MLCGGMSDFHTFNLAFGMSASLPYIFFTSGIFTVRRLPKACQLLSPTSFSLWYIYCEETAFLSYLICLIYHPLFGCFPITGFFPPNISIFCYTNSKTSSIQPYRHNLKGFLMMNMSIVSLLGLVTPAQSTEPLQIFGIRKLVSNNSFLHRNHSVDQF